MARTVYFADGTHEVLFCGVYDTEKKARELERILEDRLGYDAAALLREILDPEQTGRADLEQELKSREESCDSYRSCLQEILDAVEQLGGMLAAKRLNRKELTAEVKSIKTRITDEI